jgi:hypothetical protein
MRVREISERYIILQIENVRRSTKIALISLWVAVSIGLANSVLVIYSIATYAKERNVVITKIPQTIDTVFVKIDSRKVDSLAKVVNEQSKEITQNKILIDILLGPKLKRIGPHLVDHP